MDIEAKHELNIEYPDKGVPVICIHETFWQSIVADTYSLGGAIGGVALNYYFLGNSGILNFFLISLIIVYIVSRGSNKVHRTTTRDLRATLDKIERETAEKG